MSEDTKRCPYCREEINIGAIKCKHCGSMLDTAPGSPSDSPGSERPAAPLAADTVLSGRYRIIRELGRGGMGVVYLARDQELDMYIAVKFLPVEVANDRRALDQLRLEARLSMSLTHSNIMRLHTLDASGQLKFLVMEYVDGPNLLDILRIREKLPLNEALPIIRAICEGLGYAHSKRVLHRDLKPANIMMTSRGEVKITDFGIARRMRESLSLLSQKTVSSTPAYMAPEHIMGEHLTARSDIYSLGAVAYELLAGHPPFYTGDIPTQIRFKDPPPIPDIPDAVNNAIVSALHKDAERRPASAGDFYKALAGALLKVPAGHAVVRDEVRPAKAAEPPARKAPSRKPVSRTTAAPKEIRVVCDCGQEHVVLAKYASQNLRCNKCDAILRVPHTDGTHPLEKRTWKERRKRERHPKKKGAERRRKSDRRHLHASPGMEKEEFDPDKKYSRYPGQRRDAGKKKLSQTVLLGVGAVGLVMISLLIYFSVRSSSAQKSRSGFFALLEEARQEVELSDYESAAGFYRDALTVGREYAEHSVGGDIDFDKLYQSAQKECHAFEQLRDGIRGLEEGDAGAAQKLENIIVKEPIITAKNAAYSVLIRHAPASAAKAGVRVFLEDKDTYNHELALQWLGKLKTPVLFDILRQVVSSGSPVADRLEDLAINCCDSAWLPVIRKSLESTDITEQRLALRFLIHIPSEESYLAAGALVDSANPVIRMEALAWVLRGNDQRTGMVAVRALADDNSRVREAAGRYFKRNTAFLSNLAAIALTTKEFAGPIDCLLRLKWPQADAQLERLLKEGSWEVKSYLIECVKKSGYSALDAEVESALDISKNDLFGMTRQQLGSLLPFIFARNEHKQILGRIFEKNDFDQVCEMLNYMNEHALKEDFPLVQDYLTRFKSYRQMPKQSRHLETLFMAANMVGWKDTARVFAVSWQLNELLQKGKFTASLRVTVLESGPARETEVTVRNRTADRIQVAFWGQGDTYVEWIPPGDSAVMGEIGFVLPGEYDILLLSTDPSFKPEVSLSQSLKEKTAYSVDISGTK